MSLVSASFDFRAEFYDVDSMNVMWHGNYVKYLEAARCRFLDLVGFNYLAMKEAGFALPIVKMQFKYIKPIFFNDKFEILVHLASYGGFLCFDYEFFKDKMKLCKANTAQMAVNLKGESFYELPKPFCHALESFIQKRRA